MPIWRCLSDSWACHPERKLRDPSVVLAHQRGDGKYERHADYQKYGRDLPEFFNGFA